MTKLKPETEVLYRRWDHEYEPYRSGVVKVWGHKWIQVLSKASSKIEWSTPELCKKADETTSETQAPVSQPTDTPTVVVPLQTQSKLQQPVEELTEESVFTVLTPGSVVSYSYCSSPKDKQGKGIAGTYYGFFVKYEKVYRTVTIRTIPPYQGEPKLLQFKEYLVSPVYGQRGIDLVTGKRLDKIQS